MSPPESAAKRRRLAALEQTMASGQQGGGGAARAAPHAPPPGRRRPGPAPTRPPGLPVAPPAAALTVDDPLYDPLPPALIAGPLAALTRAAEGRQRHAPPPGGPSTLLSGDLGALLASLAATTPRGGGPDAAAREAALGRLAERHLLLDNPTAGLKKKRGDGAGASRAAGGAVPGVAPAGAASAAFHPRLSHAARRAVVGRLAGGAGSKTVPLPALAALSVRWKSYAGAALGETGDKPPSLPPWLDLHGAPAAVLACRDGRQVSVVGEGEEGFPFIIVRDGPVSWGLADVASGRVRWVGKSGTELGVGVGGGVVRVAANGR